MTETEHFAAEALDTLQEWMRRVAVPTDYPPELEDCRVIWTTSGVFHLEDQWGTRRSEDFRVTVLVEPAESWTQVTWTDVAQRTPENPGPRDERPLVSLAGVEAVVLSAVLQRWHVDPRSPDRYPRALEHDVVRVRLQVDGQTEEKFYSMPPTGPVMLLTGSPTGPAIAALLAGGFNPEPISRPHDPSCLPLKDDPTHFGRPCPCWCHVETDRPIWSDPR
jgi:hypothetical protein